MSNPFRFSPRLSLSVPAILVGMMLVSSFASAQVSPSVDRPPVMSDQGGAIPVSVVDGRLIVACDISGPRLRVPVNLWLDFDGAFGLQLHNRAAAPLPAETPAGKPLPLTLHFPDFTLEIARRELGPEEEFETFTKYHSRELGENALTGAIGGDILKHFDVIFDLPRGQVLLAPPGQLEQQQGDPLLGDVVVPISLQNDLVWLPVTLQGPGSQGASSQGAGSQGASSQGASSQGASSQGAISQGASELPKRAMAIGSSRYDSVLDRRLCNSLRRPAGNVGPVVCESIDFSPYVAFRPDEVVQVHPDGVAGVMGINLLERFRIHVDRHSLLATLR
ncbi:MAG: hypothetical protein P8L85_12645, partial [Rubripirellula sp.]|nr:hypothetical protein [Rubripirellula sp.]